MSELAYDFTSPRKIVFGWGRRREIGPLAAALGRRALVVDGLPETVAEPLLDELSERLRAAGVEPVLAGRILHEPLVEDVDRLAAALRAGGAGPGDFVLGLGGGAAIDLAKAVAAMAVETPPRGVREFLEGVGGGARASATPLPVLAMPTTAGTGAEATRNAVIASYDPPFKKSLRDERIQPAVALVDPELTVTMPPEVTAAAGMDAITQLIESFISRKARPIPRALAIEGLRLALPAVVEAARDGRRRAAREAMAHAALLSGLALANSGLGFAHGVAPALGTCCRVPHGLACAVLLPVALRVNREVARDGLAELARRVLPGGPPNETADAAVDRLIAEIEQIRRRLGIPERLSALGVRREQIPEIVRGSRGSSMSGNPRELSDDELAAILEAMV